MSKNKLTVEQALFYSLPLEYRRKLRKELMDLYNLRPIDFIKLLHEEHERFSLQYGFTNQLLIRGMEMREKALKEFPQDFLSFKHTLRHLLDQIKVI